MNIRGARASGLQRAGSLSSQRRCFLGQVSSGGTFAHRWGQTREAIRAMKELWSKEERIAESVLR